MIWLLLMVLVLVGLFVWAFATAEMAPELRQRYAALRSTPEPKRETETAPVTLQQELERLPADIAADFGCPGRGPHAWTSATIPHVSAQYCRHCPARKPIPGRVDPLGVPEPESEPAPVTLEQRLEWLPADIVADFGCPSRGPHEWTSANIPHVRNQYCRHCDAKKAIPGRDAAPPRGWWTYGQST